MLYLRSRGSLLTGWKAFWVTNGKELPAQSVSWTYCPFQCFDSKGGNRNKPCLWRKWKEKQTSSLPMQLFFKDTQIIMCLMDLPTQRWAKLVKSSKRSCYPKRASKQVSDENKNNPQGIIWRLTIDPACNLTPDEQRNTTNTKWSPTVAQFMVLSSDLRSHIWHPTSTSTPNWMH